MPYGQLVKDIWIQVGYIGYCPTRTQDVVNYLPGDLTRISNLIRSNSSEPQFLGRTVNDEMQHAVRTLSF